MSPAEVVQRQVDAYNARDLDRFVATYDDAIEVFRMPATTPAITGKAALAAFYATQRFIRPGLHAEIVNRIAFGNKVIDHERIAGLGAKILEVAVVYEVRDARIRTTWLFGAA